MFKRITAILLLLAFSAQTFSSPFVWLDYYMNTNSYARDCINKARPKMHCNGKCQVMKKLRDEEKKEQQSNEQKAESKAPVLSSRSFFCSIQPVHFVTLIKYHHEKKYPLTDISYSFFRPPRA